MSWRAINQIIALACVDQGFWRALQKDPLAAVQERGFDLTAKEQAVFGQIAVTSISEFCQLLMVEFPQDRQDRDP